MAEPILIIGKSGAGKSTSLRSLPAEQTVIIKPNAKSFPFPGGDANYTTEKQNLLISNELDAIAGTIQHISSNMPNIKYCVLEDFTHFFSARIFSTNFLSRNTGGEAFQRWNDFGASVYQAIFEKAQDWRQDLYIIVIHHTEVKDDGTVGFKSAGKLLDNVIDFPSYFNYILHAVTTQSDKGVNYVFQTNTDASRHAKSPYGIFELYIPNDIKPVLDKIGKYKKGELKIEWK